MARRKTSINPFVIVLLIFAGIPVLLVLKLSESFGSAAIILGSIAVLGLLIGLSIQRKAARVANLRAKYGNEEIVQRILRHNFWEGQSSEQLRDALGAPLAIDNALLKTRKREVWKYNQRGKNRFGLRITLDDDRVAYWDQK